MFLLPLAPGRKRPSATRDIEGVGGARARPGVMASGRPGRAQQREATTDQGAFELKFVDLTPGRQYLAWVEGEVSPGRETPDYLARSLPSRHPPTDRRDDRRGRPHEYVSPLRRAPLRDRARLQPDAQTSSFGVEVLRDRQRPDGAGTVVRVVRRPTVNKAGFDNGTAEEALEFDAPRKLVRELPLACLPLVPLASRARPRASIRARFARPSCRNKIRSSPASRWFRAPTCCSTAARSSARSRSPRQGLGTRLGLRATWEARRNAACASCWRRRSSSCRRSPISAPSRRRSGTSTSQASPITASSRCRHYPDEA